MTDENYHYQPGYLGEEPDYRTSVPRCGTTPHLIAMHSPQPRVRMLKEEEPPRVLWSSFVNQHTRSYNNSVRTSS